MYATEEQARILREAVAEIKKHPETFEMSIWAGRTYDDSNQPCGTVCCLAGQIVRNSLNDAAWEAMVRSEEASNDTPIKDEALRVMGCVRLDRLFIVDEWPEAFRPDVLCECDEYDEECFCELRNPTPEQLETRVEHWLQTGE